MGQSDSAQSDVADKPLIVLANAADRPLIGNQRATAARDVPVGTCWAFREHRTLAEGSPSGDAAADLVRDQGHDRRPGGAPGFRVRTPRVPPGSVVSADAGSFAPKPTAAPAGRGRRA